MNLKALTIGLLALLMPLQAAAALRLEFGIEPIYSLAFANPAKGYFKDLNEDFRTGEYTWEIPMPDWKDIKTPSLNEFGGEGSCLVKLKSGKIKKPRVGVVLGYRISSPKSSYNESYKDVYSPLLKSYGDMKFNRQEKIGISTFFLGARGKASLTDTLDASATVGLNFYKVRGDVDYTRKTMYPWYTKECVNLHKADYSGNGTGVSIEGDVSVNLPLKVPNNPTFKATNFMSQN